MSYNPNSDSLVEGSTNRYVTTAQETILSNTSGTNTGDETAARIGSLINGSAAATPNDTDLVATAESSVLKKITWTNVKAFLKTYFDTLYQAAGTYLTSANISDTAYGAGWNGETTVAPSKNAVYDEMETKQDTLVSGTNIKTVNGNSLLGSGDLSISATDPDGFTYIVAASDQDVTNAGVTNDNEFSFSTAANGKYLIEMLLCMSGNNTTGDITMDFAVGAGTMTGKGTVQNLTAAAAVQNIIMTAAAAANTTAIVTGAPSASLDDLVAIRVAFACTVTNATTFRFRFGNAAASAGRTSRRQKGSYLKYKTVT